MAYFTDNFRTPKQIDWEEFGKQKNAFETGDPEFSGSIKSHVPKFSDVKPGQQHPVGKHGQGKLFHEHVWPKGFTPERRAEVGEAMPYINSHSTNNAEDNDPVYGAQSPQRERAFVYDTIARSTINTDELRAMSYNKLGIHTGVNLPKGVAGEYHPGGESPLDDAGDDSAILLKNPKQNFDQHTGALTGKNLIHEIGHAVDDLSDPEGFDRNRDENAMYEGQNGFLPAAEGRAMGYQLAKFRATRRQVRSIRNDNWRQGYQPENITDSKYSDNRVPARETFKSNRIKAFRTARGEPVYPEKIPMGKSEPKYDQSRLPGME